MVNYARRVNNSWQDFFGEKVRRASFLLKKLKLYNYLAQLRVQKIKNQSLFDRKYLNSHIKYYLYR